MQSHEEGQALCEKEGANGGLAEMRNKEEIDGVREAIVAGGNKGIPDYSFYQ